MGPILASIAVPIHRSDSLHCTARVVNHDSLIQINLLNHHALVTILAVEEDLLRSPVALALALAAVERAETDDISRVMPPDISRTDMAAADCSLRALRSASSSAFGEFNSQISTFHKLSSI